MDDDELGLLTASQVERVAHCSGLLQYCADPGGDVARLFERLRVSLGISNHAMPTMEELYHLAGEGYVGVTWYAHSTAGFRGLDMYVCTGYLRAGSMHRVTAAVPAQLFPEHRPLSGKVPLWYREGVAVYRDHVAEELRDARDRSCAQRAGGSAKAKTANAALRRHEDFRLPQAALDWFSAPPPAAAAPVAPRKRSKGAVAGSSASAASSARRGKAGADGWHVLQRRSSHAYGSDLDSDSSSSSSSDAGGRRAAAAAAAAAQIRRTMGVGRRMGAARGGGGVGRLPGEMALRHALRVAATPRAVPPPAVLRHMPMVRCGEPTCALSRRAFPSLRSARLHASRTAHRQCSALAAYEAQLLRAQQRYVGVMLPPSVALLHAQETSAATASAAMGAARTPAPPRRTAAAAAAEAVALPPPPSRRRSSSVSSARSLPRKARRSSNGSPKAKARTRVSLRLSSSSSSSSEEDAWQPRARRRTATATASDDASAASPASPPPPPPSPAEGRSSRKRRRETRREARRHAQVTAARLAASQALSSALRHTLVRKQTGRLGHLKPVRSCWPQAVAEAVAADALPGAYRLDGVATGGM